MNWDQVTGQWEQLKGQVRQKFAKLTDDDMEGIRGRRQELVGKVQERYGIAKEEAERRLDDVISSL